MIEQSKGSKKVEIKELKKTRAVSFGMSVFDLSICQILKKQIKQKLAYFYTKNSKNRHLLSAIFRLFLEFNRDFIPLPISVQKIEQR